MFLYDPITGERRKISYKLLSGMTGKSIDCLKKSKDRKAKIKSINCYVLSNSTPTSTLSELMQKEKIENEVWVYVKNSENKYMISNKGRVKSVLYYKGKKKERILMPFFRKEKQPAVKIRVDGKKTNFYISNLVAEAFLKHIEGYVLIHKDGNSMNNSLENLMYVEKSKARSIARKSQGVPVIKIDKNTLEELDNYSTISEAAKSNFIDISCIHKCLKGKQKTAGGFCWKIDQEFC